MSTKRHKPEEIVAKLRQVDVLTAQGRPVEETIRAGGSGHFEPPGGFAPKFATPER